MTQNVFVTSSLPYVNNVPHLGNIIGSTLSGDICARYYKQIGNNTIHVCGTDEYGSTTTVRAIQEDLTPQEICDKYHDIHRQIYQWFNIDFDVFGRTTTQLHTQIVHEIFTGLVENDLITEMEIIQSYCEKCQMFLADRYVKGICYHIKCKDMNNITHGDQCEKCLGMIDANKLISPECCVCSTTPISRNTKHLYLKLNELQEKIAAYVNTSNFSYHVAAIANSWLVSKLSYRCITRDIEWGTPLPDSYSEYTKKSFYVWFDAPIGYYSILASLKSDWKEFLNSSNTTWISTQGKDNVPFHTIFFPGTILGSHCHLPLIHQICCTEYLNYESKKFSKSKGIGLFGDEVIKISRQLQINEDYWRFYLIKIRPEKSDTNFVIDDFVTTIETDCNNNIGNFIVRCFSMVQKFLKSQAQINMISIINEYSDIIAKYHQYMRDFSYSKALKICLKFCQKGNVYVQSSQPWRLYKTNPDDNKVSEIISFSISHCLVLLDILHPFIPGTIQKVKNSYHITDNTLTIIDNIPVPFKKINVTDVKEAILLVKNK